VRIGVPGLERRVTQVARLLAINWLETVTHEVVEAARGPSDRRGVGRRRRWLAGRVRLWRLPAMPRIPHGRLSPGLGLTWIG
jgi:hypothetical protein